MKRKRGIRYTVEIGGKLYTRVPIGKLPNGKTDYYYEQVDGPDEAIQLIAKIRREFGEYGTGAAVGRRMMFTELIAQYRRIYPDKPDWYIEPLEKFFGTRKITSITHADCLQFKAAREAVKDQRYKNQAEAAARKPATIHRELEALRHVLLFAVDNEWIPKNPFKRRRGHRPLIDKKQEKKRKRFPTPDEEAALLAVCVPPREHLRPLIIASLDTGLRRGALQELIWSCVDFTSGLLFIPEGNQYKNRPDCVGMTIRLETVIRELYENSDKHPDTPIFGEIKDFKRSWKTACKLAGVHGLRFNDLRHGYSTALMDARVNKEMLKKAAGHTTDAIQDIYENLDQRIALDLAAALNRLHESREKSKYVN